MTTKWSKQWPQEDGWYWVKHNAPDARRCKGRIVCPARLLNLNLHGIQCVHTHYGYSFFSNSPKDVKNIAFGQRIQEPTK